MKPKVILLVEDEPKIVEFTESYLTNAGYRTIVAMNGNDALQYFENTEIDLILLDLMLPDRSGESICRHIRQTSDVPIIMITAKSDEESIINGLMMGADDYITKPFSPRQMIARVHTLFRRSDYRHNMDEQNSPLFINSDNYTVMYNQQNLNLTRTEFMILSTLATRPSKVFTRDELATLAYEGQYEGFVRNIDSHIKNIRNKINKVTATEIIRTVRGIGYQIHLQDDCYE